MAERMQVLARSITVTAGVWLVVAPAVVGYGDPAASNDRLVGPMVAALAFVSAWEVLRSLRWVAFPLGAWLLVAPLVLSYPDPAASISSVVVGVVVLAATPWGRPDVSRFGGGWRTVLGKAGTEA